MLKQYPFYKQLDRVDCGPTCLRMIAKYHGKRFNLETLRRKSFISRQGVSILALSNASEEIGFRSLSAIVPYEELSEVPLPCILHWKKNHFVVLYNIRKNIATIGDPIQGIMKIEKDDFMRCWEYKREQYFQSGVALFLEPSPKFYENEDEKENRLSVRYFLNYLRPFRKYYVQIILSMIVGIFFSLIVPFLTQAMVDIGINNKNLHFINMLLIGQVVMLVSTTAITFMRSWLFLHIGARMNIAIISDYLIKLMKLPIAYFEQKSIGDLLQRIGDHSRIQSFISSNTLNTIFSFFSFFIYAFILAYYKVSLLLIFLSFSTVYAFWVALFLKKRKEFDYKLFDRSSKKQTLLIQLISGIRDIKLHNYENQKRWQWEQVQVQNFKISVRQLMMQQYQQVGAIIIDTTKNILISFMSAKAVIDGEITLGMMFSIQYIIGQLNSPVSLLIGFINSYQDARISLERIGEIHRNEDEAKAVNEFGFRTLPADKTLRFENFSFDYDGPNSPKVLKNINLEIPFGKTTAIVGASGSGKTTILKLLLKFYTRYEGRIKLGNQDLKDINHKAWRESCGVVLQDGFLFSESIASNIALGDENISLEKLDFACDVANITDFVRGLPLGYNTMIGNDGVGISQGQRQRILIARAVYKNPEFIFFDEATNSLDTNNERVIVHNLERFFRGKTVVVVAHRLSTVKNADQIVVLEKGEIAEIGTHDGLIENRSYYFSLIKNQLELSH